MCFTILIKSESNALAFLLPADGLSSPMFGYCLIIPWGIFKQFADDAVITILEPRQQNKDVLLPIAKFLNDSAPLCNLLL